MLPFNTRGGEGLKESGPGRSPYLADAKSILSEFKQEGERIFYTELRSHDRRQMVHQLHALPQVSAIWGRQAEV